MGAHWDAVDAVHRGADEKVPKIDTPRKPGLPTRKTRRREREPPPLDDLQAKYVLDLLLRLIASPLTDDGHAGKREAGNNSQSEERSLDGLPRKASDIERASFKVIEYLSASNWALVFHTMSQRLKFLRTTASDDGDASGLQFIAHMWINQEKLSLIIKEISGSFLPLRKTAQNMLATILPETIHRWIDANPTDFIDLHVNNRRLEKGIDVLFDVAASLADGVKRRPTIWPLQTALILLLPDAFWMLEMRSEQRGSLAKKVAFLNELRRSLRLPKSSDFAASCLIVICRAGSLFPALSDSALLSFALDVQNDVTEEIFRRQQLGDDLSVDRDIMIKAFVSSARLNVESVVENLLPRCLDKNSPIGFKITVFAGVAVLATQVRMFCIL
jgi:neurofibromin 1